MRKTAVSIPDDVFADAEQLARALKKSRSQLYSDALRDYIARHSSNRITEALDRIWERGSDAPDSFLSRSGARVLGRTEW